MDTKIVRMPPEMKRLIAFSSCVHGCTDPSEPHTLESSQCRVPWTQESRPGHLHHRVFFVETRRHTSVTAEADVGVSQSHRSARQAVPAFDPGVCFRTAICDETFFSANTQVFPGYLVAGKDDALQCNAVLAGD